MVQIEFLKQLWKNCLRQSRLEDVLHTASGENQIITIAALTDGLSSQQVEYKGNDLLSISFEEKLQANLLEWAQTSNGYTSSIDDRKIYKDIYALLADIE